MVIAMAIMIEFRLNPNLKNSRKVIHIQFSPDVTILMDHLLPFVDILTISLKKSLKTMVICI